MGVCLCSTVQKFVRNKIYIIFDGIFHLPKNSNNCSKKQGMTHKIFLPQKMKHLNNLYKFIIFYKINFTKFIGERMKHPRKKF